MIANRSLGHSLAAIAKKQTLVALAIAGTFATAASAADIIYSVDLRNGDNFVTGTITTNGALGTIQQSAITDINLTVAFAGGRTDSLQSLSFYTEDSNIFAEATSTALTVKESSDVGFYSDDLYNYSFSITFFGNSIYTDWYEDEGRNSGRVYFSGNVIGTAAAAAVPEPSTYALMLAGLVGVAAVARRRKAA